MEHKRILLADSNAFFRQVWLDLLQNYLELSKARIEVEEACDGRQAFDKLITNHQVFDVILLSLLMSHVEFNGLELIRRLKEQPDTQTILARIIAVSASPEALVEAQQLGIKYTLHKPFSLEKLVDLFCKEKLLGEKVLIV